ncbi:MAG: glucokinase [Chitinophagales bacterium]|jgi:glucokinase
MEQTIVADIGGTNTRFAIATKSAAGFDISAQWIQTSDKFSGLEDALAVYLQTIDSSNITKACLAVAGPIVDGKVRVTRQGWDATIVDMKKQFGFTDFNLINDFTALAFSLPYLSKADTLDIYSQGEAGVGVKAIIGPGTGFGVAGLMPTNNSWQLIDGEGGHISFAPTNALEIEILKVLMTRSHRVSIESILCGPGLVNLYSAMAAVRGETAKALAPKDIAELGSSGVDPLCEAALHSFCAIMGSAAGDIALVLRPTGGMYLAGGILPKIKDFFLASDFSSRFLAKEPMSHVVADIPIMMLATDDAAFVGAAAALELAKNN